MSTFAEQVAEALLAEASALGARWQTQTRIVAPRVRSRATPAHGVLPSPSPQGPSPASTTAAAAAASPAIINALAHVVVTEGLTKDDYVAQRCEAESYEKWKKFVAEPRNSE